VPPSLPTFVVFRCPGTEKEPDHPSTPEAVAAIAHALHEPRQPMVVGQDGTTKADEAITGADRDLTVATKTAIQEMIDFLAATKGLTKHEAYQLTSVAGDVAITQLVDQTLGVHVKMPKSIFKK
jgi:acetamidase/formamidase